MFKTIQRNNNISKDDKNNLRKKPGIDYTQMMEGHMQASQLGAPAQMKSSFTNRVPPSALAVAQVSEDERPTFADRMSPSALAVAQASEEMPSFADRMSPSALAVAQASEEMPSFAEASEGKEGQVQAATNHNLSTNRTVSGTDENSGNSKNETNTSVGSKQEKDYSYRLNYPKGSIEIINSRINKTELSKISSVFWRHCTDAIRKDPSEGNNVRVWYEQGTTPGGDKGGTWISITVYDKKVKAGYVRSTAPYEISLKYSDDTDHDNGDLAELENTAEVYEIVPQGVEAAIKSLEDENDVAKINLITITLPVLEGLDLSTLEDLVAESSKGVPARAVMSENANKTLFSVDISFFYWYTVDPIEML